MKRLGPGYTNVKKVKLWAKLNEKTPWWPCIGYIRTPVFGSAIGVNELKVEKKLYIEPCGRANKFITPFFRGVWLPTNKMEPYGTQCDARKANGLDYHLKTFVEEFELALADCEANPAVIAHFRFSGSLDEISHAERKKMANAESSVVQAAKDAAKAAKKAENDAQGITGNAAPSLIRLDKNTSVRLVSPKGYMIQSMSNYYSHLSQLHAQMTNTSDNSHPSAATSVPVGASSSAVTSAAPSAATVGTAKTAEGGSLQMLDEHISMFVAAGITSYFHVNCHADAQASVFHMDNPAPAEPAFVKVCRKSKHPIKFRGAMAESAVYPVSFKPYKKHAVGDEDNMDVVMVKRSRQG